MSRSDKTSAIERDSSVFLPEGEEEIVEVVSDISFFGKKKFPPESPLGIDDEEYCMSYPNRGKVIIFNHETYAKNLNVRQREGTKIDEENLLDTFQNLNFNVRILNDPSKKTILEKLTKEKENDFHRNSACLVVVVLTHGKDNGILYAHDNVYEASELWAPFMATNCANLATKPKIFIIQACRGENISLAVEVNKTELTTDSIKMPDKSAAGTFSIPNEADILVAYSTFEGRVAYRDPSKGTWYISELCKELNKSSTTDDLLTILTRVNRQVALTKELKQMPSIQSTLTRKLYFNNNREKLSLPVSSQQEINEKLDRILSICAKPRLPSSTNASNPSSSRQMLAPNDWNELWNELQNLQTVDLPAETVALRTALKMFVDEWVELDEEVRENGRLILVLLSWWQNLNANTRKYAYMKAKSFLQLHAKEWPMLKITDILNEPPLDVPPARTGKRSRKSSTQSVTSDQAPKPRPPFKN